MSKAGEFTRDTRYLDGRITADGRDGWPAAPDRYRLVVARGCPWANRTMIVRRGGDRRLRAHHAGHGTRVDRLAPAGRA